mgnify:CR=1 FL=1|jgi:hypothetical protein|tara:strand:+ start:6958 stop:7557 length:600 start_codon:yes stop_codon:yes gene_type:complete
MAASDIELINRSLALLGIESITSLSDNTKQASVARVLYNDTRAAVFRGHPWNCLTKRASLPTDVTNPVYGFSKRFALPADFLRLLEVERGADITYQLERGHLLSDEDTMNIKYTALITDVTLYDTLLIDTLSARIAADLAQPLLQSTSAMEQMWQMYELKLREAKFVDAQEQAQDVLDADYWLDSRQGISRPNLSTPPR